MIAGLMLMLRLAIRNVRTHMVKNSVIGVILVFGTFVLVTGATLIGSLDKVMRKSITTSITADLQAYDADARDPLSLLGDMNFGGSDNGEIPDYSAVQDTLAKVPEVRTTLPFGLGNATVFGANEVDRSLEDLRAAVKAGDQARQTMLVGRLQRIAGDIRPQLDLSGTITADQEKLTEDRASLDRVISADFPAQFAADPVATMDWMDGAVAPLATDGRLNYFRLLGTDIPAFESNFPRMQIVHGTTVPPGERGIIINESSYELMIKHPIARELDLIEKEIASGTEIGTSGTLFDRVQRMSRQYRRVLYQLDTEEVGALEPKLRAELKDDKSDMVGLLKAFLAVSDDNFSERKAFFYSDIAPYIRLYDISVGDTLPLRAFTKSGYLKSVNVKVYGVYHYSGVAKDDAAAGAYSLVDMLTFRDIYGKMTASQQAELSGIKASVGAKDLGASGGSIDDELFGGGGSIESTVASTEALTGLDSVTFGRAEEREITTFTQDEVDHGVATSTAIFLKNPEQAEVGKTAVEKALGDAGLKLTVVGWKQASGFVGQAAMVIQLVLFIAVLVLFLVAIVIINIALVLATLERTSEIGTMRALGAQARFVTWMFVVESQFVGLVSACIGATFSGLFVNWLHTVGIPAGNDFLSVLFGGKAMYPEQSIPSMILGIVIVQVVSLLATIYPAWLAADVPPVVALQGKE